MLINNYFLNSVGIDTIRFLIPSNTLKKFLIDNSLVMLDSCRNYIINHYLDRKEIKQNRDYDVKFVKIGKVQNLSAYILIKYNLESVSLSKDRKKAKDYYCEVVFAGLRQPTKKISIETYKALSVFIKRFKVSDLDICFDGTSNININEKNIAIFNFMFQDYVNSFSDTLIETSSFYINVPNSPIIDTDYFKKILVYDKYIKESRYKKLDDSLKNWKRLETTVNVKCKFKEFILDDYIQDVETMAKKYFNSSSFSYEYLELQKKLLTDKRTHRGIKSL